MVMIEVIANDRLGKKVRIKCDSEDTVGDLKVCILEREKGVLFIHFQNS